MIHAGTAADALPTRFSRSTPDGHLVWRNCYFGPAPSPTGSETLGGGALGPAYTDPLPGELRSPQAFLVEQEAGAIVPPHFHYVNQFQVVVAGGGLLGRHPVQPISVHYAGACTGYGPIQPGAAGLSYFTFRASADETGAQYLPAARARMRAGPRRNVVVETIAPDTAQALQARTQSVTECSLSQSDGLAVFMLRIAPNGTLAGPDAALGGGMSVLVTGGAIVREGASYAAWSCLYLSADEGAIDLTAGAQGAEVLVMRYPAAATATTIATATTPAS